MNRFILLTILFLSCSPKSDNTSEISVSQNNDLETKEMIALLKNIHNKIDPTQINYFQNTHRSDLFKAQWQDETNPLQKQRRFYTYAMELLLAGKVTDCIAEIEKHLASLGQSKEDLMIAYNLNRVLGLAYLRAGEVENCIGKNNAASCIIPIQGKGVYKNKASSERAAYIFSKILQDYPADHDIIWLLNLAYMTMGQYPDQVPSSFRIPPEKFVSEYQIRPFENISTNLGVGAKALSGGAVIEDLNNDGFLDIAASSWGINDQIKIFFNNGDGTFIDHTSQSGLTGLTGGLNLIHTDYNNDGYIDLYVLRGAWFLDQGQIPNSLLRNNGNGTFTDVTKSTGLLSFQPTQTATWSDFNLDGWVDLFVGNETSSKHMAPCELYINHQGVFKNAIEQTGLSEYKAMIKGVSSGDINNDGWPDLYISTIGSNNKLFINNGELADNMSVSFTDITIQAGVKEPTFSFPTWMWDYNNDGFLDIFAAPFPSVSKSAPAFLIQGFLGNDVDLALPKLYKNNGNGSFTDVGKGLGLIEPVFAMGSNYGDIDNDGNLDFYLGSGEPSMASLVPNKMYRNNKGESFQDVTYSGRLGHVQKGHGVSFGDIDNDGDLDIFHVLGGAFEGDIFGDALFRNAMNGEVDWINIKLVGTTSNKAAIGARLRINYIDHTENRKTIHRTISTGGSFGSNSLEEEIGLGDVKELLSIQVQWPNKSREIATYKDVPLNSYITITEGVAQATYEKRNSIKFD